MRLGLLFFASVCLLAFGLHTWHDAQHKGGGQTINLRQIITKKPKATLISKRQFQEVHIPFTSRHGWIMVPATIAGRHIECLLDTGSLRVFDWPTSLHLPGRRVGLSYPRLVPYQSARPRFAEWVILPEIDIGDYHLRECPSLAHSRDPNDLPGLSVPTLGCAAFADVVLTIDYKKKELVVHSTDYDITQDAQELSRYPKHSLFDLLLSERTITLWDGKTASTTGIPALCGNVAGHPVQIAIDTGLIHVGLALTSKPLIKTLSEEGYVSTPVPPCSDCSPIATFPSVSWNMGRFVNTGHVSLLPGFFAKDEAVLGAESLKNYRITLDFPRHKIMLALNP